MDENTFKKLLDESLEPIKGDLDQVKRDLKDVKNVQEQHTKVLEQHTDLIENRILPSVTYIETTVKSYADRYVANEDHIQRLQTRLVTVEDNLEIEPPEDLKIPHFSTK